MPIGRVHKKLLKQAGLPDIRFYDLRDTLRNTGSSKRSGCEDPVLHAGTLQRGLYHGHLHPRYHEDADRSRGQIGRIHGAIILKHSQGIDKKLLLELMLQGELVRVGRLELPASCSQTAELNFLWYFLMIFNTFRYIPLTLWRS